MQKQKEQKRSFRKIKVNGMNSTEKNGCMKKTKILKKRRFGELKLGFFADAGFGSTDSD
jgi:hypothetical protein